ncbi:glycosyltransferase [Vibrio gigantis]|uniref:glycosyltransferase family 2 protein n=1 Tax=Vibrio gigantis TaxID=296199 RepID=UPI001EFA8539|nr:glycosyltransferase [Vibrio gigantis]ULN64469.1 glycosyltransferase [Vibrio gigantis]
MKKYKVAIFTAYYNREDFVKDSIQSLLDQDYDDFIVIAINDGSTDNTLKILQEFDDENLIVIDKINSGFVSSMKEAIERFDCEYIAIHGSGDISYTNRISSQVQVLKENPTVGVVGCHYKNTDLTRGISILTQAYSGKINGNVMLDILRNKNPLTQGEIMIRRTDYDAVGGYNTLFTFSQDYDLWLRLSLITDFYIVPECLYERYVRSDGVSGNVDKIAVQQFLASLARMNAGSRSNVVSLFSKAKDKQLKIRLIKLTIRAACFDINYPSKLCTVNKLEFGSFSLILNSILFVCKVREFLNGKK